jgi:peroxiredoxin
LARSKLKRDGLKTGTPAPDFRLPRLDGRGDLSLSELRGKRVLLVFSHPHCGPCDALAPELEKFYRRRKQNTRSPSPLPSPPGEGGPSPGVEVVMISRGEPKESRAKVKEHGLTFPVGLQQQWEISRRYAMFTTPVAYLIDQQGAIIHDVAVGVEPILTLMNKVTHHTQERELAMH